MDQPSVIVYLTILMKAFFIELTFEVWIIIEPFQDNVKKATVKVVLPICSLFLRFDHNRKLDFSNSILYIFIDVGALLCESLASYMPFLHM